MSVMRVFEFPQDQGDRLEREAREMGLSVPAYVDFLRNCRARKHDAEFIDAAGAVFKDYPETLRKLGQ